MQYIQLLIVGLSMLLCECLLYGNSMFQLYLFLVLHRSKYILDYHIRHKQGHMLLVVCSLFLQEFVLFCHDNLFYKYHLQLYSKHNRHIQILWLHLHRQEFFHWLFPLCLLWQDIFLILPRIQHNLHLLE